MLATLAEIAWLATRFWPVSASGRSTSSTAAIPNRTCQESAHSRDGSLAVTNVMTRPMKTGIIEFEQCHHQAEREQCREQALCLPGEVPIERDEAAGRLGACRAGGRVEGGFEQAEHGFTAKCHGVSRPWLGSTRWGSPTCRPRFVTRASRRRFPETCPGPGRPVIHWFIRD